ncbi:MAG TPA: hypothetical protein VGJ66_20730, partial [Pyrinomonadaceae bacterium]
MRAASISCMALLLVGLLLYAQAQSSKQAYTSGLAVTDHEGLQLPGQPESNQQWILTGVAPPSVKVKSELVKYPNAGVAFICGPQLRAGSP